MLPSTHRGFRMQGRVQVSLLAASVSAFCWGPFINKAQAKMLPHKTEGGDTRHAGRGVLYQLTWLGAVRHAWLTQHLQSQRPLHAACSGAPMLLRAPAQPHARSHPPPSATHYCFVMQYGETQQCLCLTGWQSICCCCRPYKDHM